MESMRIKWSERNNEAMHEFMRVTRATFDSDTVNGSESISSNMAESAARRDSTFSVCNTARSNDEAKVEKDNEFKVDLNQHHKLDETVKQDIQNDRFKLQGSSLPLPPANILTHLQLELSWSEPPEEYIYRPKNVFTAYEATWVKLRRLGNFFLLPLYLERTLIFGVLCCLDSFLYVFTILPLRLIYILWVLVKWVWANTRFGVRESLEWGEWSIGQIVRITGFLTRKLNKLLFTKRTDGSSVEDSGQFSRYVNKEEKCSGGIKFSNFSLNEGQKADLLKGLVVLISCVVLMKFDASRMYHSIRGQSAIKLYVIYNVLEVSDRLFAAIGQDIYECLLSREMINAGQKRLFRAGATFILALVYNTTHAVALFYQVITLNVAVNSYSNALLSLLLSNQFVEIKSSVFKKIEKENLFQMMCADAIERFQIWLMMIIIALRNVAAFGGFSIARLFTMNGSSTAGGSVGNGGNRVNGNGNVGSGHSASYSSTESLASPAVFSNFTRPSMSRATVVPTSFTVLPSWAGRIFGPLVVVLGSEILVDWLKHSFITKFNNIRRESYDRFLDILARDYYTNAFSANSLVTRDITRRLGLPVYPLACLFIRVAFQVFQVITGSTSPRISSSTISSTASSASTSFTASNNLRDSPYTLLKCIGIIITTFEKGITLILRKMNVNVGWMFRDKPGDLGNLVGWSLHEMENVWISLKGWVDNAWEGIARWFLLLNVWIGLFLFKLILGMVLLRYARSRYAVMCNRVLRSSEDVKQANNKTERDNSIRENAFNMSGCRRVGGWGSVEVDDIQREHIYTDDAVGLKKARERAATIHNPNMRKHDENKRRKSCPGSEGDGDEDDVTLSKVLRYSMVAKRIW